MWLLSPGRPLPYRTLPHRTPPGKTLLPPCLSPSGPPPGVALARPGASGAVRALALTLAESWHLPFTQPAQHSAANTELVLARTFARLLPPPAVPSLSYVPGSSFLHFHLSASGTTLGNTGALCVFNALPLEQRPQQGGWGSREAPNTRRRPLRSPKGRTMNLEDTRARTELTGPRPSGRVLWGRCLMRIVSVIKTRRGLTQASCRCRGTGCGSADGLSAKLMSVVRK